MARYGSDFPSCTRYGSHFPSRTRPEGSATPDTTH